MTLALRDPPIPDSPLARWDARWKLAAVALLGFGVAPLDGLAPLTAAAGAVAGVALVGARLPADLVAGRALLLAVSVAPLVVLLPVVDFERGAAAALAILARLVTIGLAGLALTRTTPMPTLFAAAQALRVPGVLVQVVQTAHRYTFLLAGEVRRMRVALRTRAFRLRSDVHTYRTLGYTVGALLVRGADRAETVAAAMRSRGFDGTFRTTTTFRTAPADALGFAATLLGVAALHAWEWHVWEWEARAW